MQLKKMFLRRKTTNVVVHVETQWSDGCDVTAEIPADATDQERQIALDQIGQMVSEGWGKMDDHQIELFSTTAAILKEVPEGQRGSATFKVVRNKKGNIEVKCDDCG